MPNDIHMSLFLVKNIIISSTFVYSWISTNSLLLIHKKKIIFYYIITLLFTKVQLFIEELTEALFPLQISQYLPAMNPLFFFFLSSLFIKSLSSKVEPAKNNAHITVMGFVYCDICSNNSFTKHSYFLPGAGVKIDCKFKASAPKVREQVSFSVNRTTNRHGVYRLEIPSVDGIECAEATIESSCEATLMWSSSKSCNVPGYKSTTDQITIKAKQANLCIYSLNAMNFRPSRIDLSLCEN